jgi:hypothetical protein
VSVTLPTLTVGNAAAPNEWSSAPNGALTAIGASGQDTNFGHVSENLTGTRTYVQGWELADTPADFLGMATLTIQLRYAWSAYATSATWPLLAARIVSGTTILAAADSGGAFESVATSITTTTPTNSSVVSFTYINTAANKAAWDAAVLEIRIDRTRSGGGNTNQQRVFAAEATGTYVAVTSVSVATTGVSGAGQLGALQATGSAFGFPGGVASTGQVASVSVTVTQNPIVAVTGVSAVGQVGSAFARIPYLGSVGWGRGAWSEGAWNEDLGGVDVTVIVTGASATGQVGTAQATGTALTTLTGASATGQVGTAQATGTALTTLTGASATGQVGTAAADTEGSVTALPSGVSAAGQVGTAQATGTALTLVTGVSAAGQVGAAEVLIGVSVIVSANGVSAAGQVGAAEVVVDAGLIVPVVGVSATGRVGNVIVWGAVSTQPATLWTDTDPSAINIWNDVSPGPGAPWNNVAA